MEDLVVLQPRCTNPDSDWTQTHDWVVNRLGVLFGPVGHKVKIHKITPATDKERGDIEIKD